MAAENNRLDKSSRLTSRCTENVRSSFVLIDSFRLVTKFWVKTNELNRPKDGSGKTIGRLIPIELSMNKVFRWCHSLKLIRDNSSLGFEYCVNQTMSSWCPVEKLFHLNRRRRWFRTRILQGDPTLDQRKVITAECCRLSSKSNDL